MKTTYKNKLLLKYDKLIQKKLHIYKYLNESGHILIRKYEYV